MTSGYASCLHSATITMPGTVLRRPNCLWICGTRNNEIVNSERNFPTLTRKETRMSGYHLEWVGALTAGVGIGLSILIGTRIWPQQDRRKRVIFISVAI